MNTPDTITIDFDYALSSFDCIQGVCYKNKNFNGSSEIDLDDQDSFPFFVPLHSMVKSFVVDCYVAFKDKNGNYSIVDEIGVIPIRTENFDSSVYYFNDFF